MPGTSNKTSQCAVEVCVFGSKENCIFWKVHCCRLKLRTITEVLVILFLRDVLGKTKEAITGSFMFIGVLSASMTV